MSDNRNSGEGLQKKLSPLNVWALALGSIIGWGAFVMPANTFLPNAGPLGTAIAMPHWVRRGNRLRPINASAVAFIGTTAR